MPPLKSILQNPFERKMTVKHLSTPTPDPWQYYQANIPLAAYPTAILSHRKMRTTMLGPILDTLDHFHPIVNCGVCVTQRSR